MMPHSRPFRHPELGVTRMARLRVIVELIRAGSITLGGHEPGKLYGRLSCRAGKRMKEDNRVFFRDEAEAIAFGYRPCAVCMSEAYNVWRQTKQM